MLAGAMVVRREGKYAHSVRVIVFAEEEQEGQKVLVEVPLKPAMLVRKMLSYLTCEYVKVSNQAAEVVVSTAPG